MPVPVETIVTKEKIIEVPVDKIVEKVVYRDVPIDKIVTKEIPVEVEKVVEKVVYQEVEVPVEIKVPVTVEKIVEKEVVREVQVVKEITVPVETLVEKVTNLTSRRHEIVDWFSDCVWGGGLRISGCGQGGACGAYSLQGYCCRVPRLQEEGV